MLTEHLKEQRPVLDKQNEFMFFSNNKVAQTSVNRRLLKLRSIVYKDDHQKYESHFQDAVSKLDSIYKFTIVRKPWDRVVSAFSYLKARRRLDFRSMSFEHFVLKVLSKHGPALDAHFAPQYSKSFHDGEQFVDFIGRLENIKNDWSVIAKQISAPPAIPHVNKSKHDNYTSYYDETTRQVVGEIYKDDVEAFGYEF